MFRYEKKISFFHWTNFFRSNNFKFFFFLIFSIFLFHVVCTVHNLKFKRRHTVPIAENEGILLSYQVEYGEKLVIFEVENATTPEVNWFAVGWSRHGEIKNADFCVIIKDQTQVYVSAHDSLSI